MVWQKHQSKVMKIFSCLIISVVFMCFLQPAYSEEKTDVNDKPDRAITVSPEYTGVMVPKGENVKVDLIVANQGKQDEWIDLSLPMVPETWNAEIKTYSFGVSGVYVKSDDTKRLTLQLEPGEETAKGQYSFEIEGKSRDGSLVSSSNLLVNVTGEEKEKKKEGVAITTSYPVLRGPTDAQFEFSLEVKNELEEDAVFNLTAQGPSNWDINFKPAYEDKYLSSVRLQANQSKSLGLEVKPHPLQEPGEYPIQIKVSSPEGAAEADVTVALTGTYNLEAGTASGLLSLDAVRGKDANLSFYIRNAGSAPLGNIKFMSVKPENWKVEFTPERVDSLAPQKMEQVDVTITPDGQALVGDYSVVLSVDGEKIDKNLELRVSVKASAAWAWIGIGIILLVILGLVFLFIKLGRR
jgi:uncharacterized membrane protein